MTFYSFSDIKSLPDEPKKLIISLKTFRYLV